MQVIGAATRTSSFGRYGGSAPRPASDSRHGCSLEAIRILRGEDPEAAVADPSLRPGGGAPRPGRISLEVGGAAVTRAAAPPRVELVLDCRARRSRLPDRL